MDDLCFYDLITKVVTLDTVVDPETEPFKSKYESRKLLDRCIELVNGNGHLKGVHLTLFNAALCALKYKLAKNYVDTSERDRGNEMIADCLQFIDDGNVDYISLYTYTEVMNYAAYLREMNEDHDQAFRQLNRAVEVFETVTPSLLMAPFNFDQLFHELSAVINGDRTTVDTPEYVVSENDLWLQLEDAHTHTFYFLAQVSKNIGNNALAARHCHKTLLRQIRSPKFIAFHDWALNCATLSQYFIGSEGKNNFPQARHCLACAENMANKVEKGTSEEEISKRDQLFADINRCWIKYGLALLDTSHSVLMEPEENRMLQDLEISNEKTDEHVREPHDKLIPFSAIDCENESNQICDALVKTFDDARPIFLSVLRWIQCAIKFYALDGSCTDYVELQQDASRAYKLLATFEFDSARKCQMHKRRLNLLNGVLNELSMQFYLMLCRQLLFELGETAHEMMGIKIAALEDSEQAPNIHQIKKVNALADEAAGYFGRFIDSYLHNETKLLPKTFEHDAVRPVILAWFYRARIFGKKLFSDPQLKIGELSKSLEDYRCIVNYVDDHSDIKCLVQSEYSICADMVTLLPLKMDRLKSAAMI